MTATKEQIVAAWNKAKAYAAEHRPSTVALVGAGVVAFSATSDQLNSSVELLSTLLTALIPLIVILAIFSLIFGLLMGKNGVFHKFEHE